MNTTTTTTVDKKTTSIVLLPTVEQIQVASGLSRRHPGGRFEIVQEVSCPDEYYMAYTTEKFAVIILDDGATCYPGGAPFGR